MALNNSGEEITRLKPKQDVIRKLYLMSGNRCCYPRCPHFIIDADGDFVGEVCHIEAAEFGGQRFNPDRTNEQNRAASNLMLMCPNHHTKTNNVSLFPVAKLAEIKRTHEAKFQDIGKKIADSISDSTDTNAVSPATNLKRLNRVLRLDLDSSELEDMVKGLSRHAKNLELVPEQTRNFLGAIAARMHKVSSTRNVYDHHGTYKISVTDVEQALLLGSIEIIEKCSMLENYGLGRLEETGDFEMPWVVSILTVDGWPLWVNLAEFAKAEGIEFSTFWRDLDFSSLDE